MNILVLNCGSSSLKYQVLDMKSDDNYSLLAKGLVERIGEKMGALTHRVPDQDKYTVEMPIPDHTVGIKAVLDLLVSKEHGVLKSLKEIEAVGHRVAHGVEYFKGSALVTDKTQAEIEKLCVLAPLHNPANLLGVKAIKELMPEVPQVTTFDTAFHQTMPDYAYMYALPYELYEKYAIRRYGFHGTSHRYVSARVCEFLGVDPKGKKIVTAHIGGGGSCTAVMDGKSVDTSMGLTPVEGLMMGTRAGDLDLGAATFIMDKEHLSTTEFNNLVNKKSGLLGVSGVSSDCRDIEAAINEGNKRADLARKMFIYRVKKYIGAYAAAMNGIDILVFTAGIGENDPYIRAEIMKGLSFLGIELDEEANKVRGEERIISKKGSKVTVCLIPTDEELMIASDTAALV